MAATETTLNVAVAVDLSDEDCARITELEPRVNLIRIPGGPRASRWAGDWDGDPNFTRDAATEKAYRASLENADAILGLPDGGPDALANTVRANPHLRWVSTMAAGGGAQVKAAGLTDEELKRVTFTTSAGVHGSTLAEFAIFGILAGAKNLRRLEERQTQHLWPEQREQPQHLDEMTVLVAGLGGIGKAVAKRLKAFDATVWGTSRSARATDFVDRIIPLHELNQAVSEVDAIIITLPGTSETDKMFDAELFSAMKHGTLIANVGRGTVIDEDALLDSLNSGQIGFAALDVFAREPLDPGSELWDHPHVLVSPHSAGLTSKEGRRIAELFARNATALLDGQTMRNVVDTVNFY